MLAVSIENWSNIFKEVSQGNISVPVSNLPPAIQQVVVSEFGAIDHVSYGTWLEVFARLDSEKEGVLDISGFGKFAAKGDKGGTKGRRVKVDSGVSSQKKFTEEDKAIEEQMKAEGKSKKEVREKMDERRKERKETKKSERAQKAEKSKADDSDIDLKDEDADAEGDVHGGNKNFGVILNFVITELFERASGTREVPSPFRKGVNVNYNTILNNYTPPKLDSQKESLEQSVEDTQKELENKGGPESEEGKKYKKYVTRVEKQLAEFDSGRPKAEGLLKKVLRAKQRFYERMVDNPKVVAIAERYAAAKKEKKSQSTKREREGKKRQQMGREDTKFLKRLVDTAVDHDGDNLDEALKGVEGPGEDVKTKKSASAITLEQAQALANLYAFKARLARERGGDSRKEEQALILAKATVGLLSKTASEDMQNKVGDRFNSILEGSGDSVGDRDFANDIPSFIQGAAQQGKGPEMKEALLNSGFELDLNRGKWDYNNAYWKKDGNGDYDTRDDKFNEDGTIKGSQQESAQEEAEEEEEAPPPAQKKNYSDMMKAFTKIFLDAVLEEFKDSPSNSFESPYKEGKTVTFGTLANYGSDGYWQKEIKKAERRDAKDLDAIKERYETKKTQGKEAYTGALAVLGNFRNAKAEDTKWVYDLAKREMRVATAKDDNEKGWTWAGLTAGIQKKFAGKENRKARDINEELNLGLKSPKENKAEREGNGEGGGEEKKKKKKSKSTKSTKSTKATKATKGTKKKKNTTTES